jgi:hypothetical protein
MRIDAPRAEVCWIFWKLDDFYQIKTLGIGRVAKDKIRSYKSEQNISIALATAFENKTVRQMLVKTVLCQSELGISAGRLELSRRFSHMMKAGIRTILSTNKTIFWGCRILEIVLVNVLDHNQLVKVTMKGLEIDTDARR